MLAPALFALLRYSFGNYALSEQLFHAVLADDCVAGISEKHWQVKMEAGWKNMPLEISNGLSEQARQLNMTPQWKTRRKKRTTYSFDLRAMTQTNGTSEKVRPIRFVRVVPYAWNWQ